MYANAVVRPMTGRAACADSVAVRDGRVIAVGREREVRDAAGAGAAQVDLGGRVVFPGFVDAHHHFLQAAIYGGAVALDGCRSIEDLLVRVREAARVLPPGAWVVAHGYDTKLLGERRHPHRRELDDASPDHPALAIEYSFHDGVANARALAAAGYDRHLPDPPGGSIERDQAGELSGRLLETALLPLERLGRADRMARDEPSILVRLAGYQQDLFRHGIVRVCDPAVDPLMEGLYVRAAERGVLRVPLTMMPVGSKGLCLPPRDRFVGPRTGEGPEYLRLGPMKLFADGANRCAMCLGPEQIQGMVMQALHASVRAGSFAPIARLRARVRFDPDLGVRTGIRYHRPGELATLVRDACEHGFGVAIHAIGNEAVDDAIAALARVRARHRDDPPPRIEHATVMAPEAARRCGDAGIAIVAQPDFLRLPAFDTGAPPIPGLVTKGLRTLLDAGVLVAGSSDAPVAGFDVISAMRSAMHRRTRSGVPLQPEQAIGVYEAFDAYTRAAAIACGAGGDTGTIEPGKRADFVVLSRDPLATGGDSLDDLEVERTILGGEIVFARAESPSW
jgi:hypothetical protein